MSFRYLVLVAVSVLLVSCTGSDGAKDAATQPQQDVQAAEVTPEVAAEDVDEAKLLDEASPPETSDIPGTPDTEPELPPELPDLVEEELPADVAEPEVPAELPPVDGGCIDGEPCDDGDPCTVDDVCCAGECCSGDAKDCDDGDVCTLDGCDAAGQCVHDPVIVECDDGDPCTVGDICSLAGECLAGTEELPCDDGNECTDDSCVPGAGCDFSANTLPCDDGDLCTTGDQCEEGACKPGEYDCGCKDDAECELLDDDDLCNGGFYCNKNETPPLCEIHPASIVECELMPAEDCVIYECEPSTGDCIPIPTEDNIQCNDGNACTDQDVCIAGMCIGTPMASCGVGAPCAGPLDCMVGLTCFGGMPGGYCTKLNCMLFGCPDGAVCDEVNDGDINLCLQECDGDGDCRVEDGHGCKDTGGCWCGEEVCVGGELDCIGDLAGMCNSCGSALEPGFQNCVELDLICEAGECVECQPDCVDKECGDDGCGGSCGDCVDPEWCIVETGLCDCVCGPDDSPVCDPGTGITYPNSCEATCAGLDSFEPGACSNCQDFCTAEELQYQELCGSDGQQYENFCTLKCSIGDPTCTLDLCHQLLHNGPCTEFCWVEEAEPAEPGDELAEFVCQDLNTSSPTYQEVVSTFTLSEQVWIAYLGSCT